MGGYISSAVGAYMMVVVMAYVFQRSLMYHPDINVPDPAAFGLRDTVVVAYSAGDHTPLQSWYQPASQGKPTLVLYHGNAGNIGDRAFKAKLFIEQGMGVLLAGYRGYGGNPGKPSEEGLYQDARAALDYLKGEGIDAANIILYGESLGTGVAVQMAVEQSATQPVMKVILEAPYTTMGEAAATHYPFLPAKVLVRDRYDSLSKITRINTPLLVIHGERDATVPVKLGKKLFGAANGPKVSQWIPRAAHNDLYEYGAGSIIVDFIKAP